MRSRPAFADLLTSIIVVAYALPLPLDLYSPSSASPSIENACKKRVKRAKCASQRLFMPFLAQIGRHPGRLSRFYDYLQQDYLADL
jgi:hypothetical protein